MPFVRVAGGGRLDVGSKIAGNINAATLFNPNAPASLGNNVTEYHPPPLLVAPGVRQPARVDTFFSVVDGEIRGFANTTSVRCVWTTHRGRDIPLDPDEVKYTLESAWDNLYVLGQEVSLIQCAVKLTPHTAVGFLDNGLISQADYDRIATSPMPEPEPTTTVKHVSRTLLVLGVIGAAIYFIPRGILKGVAK